MNRRLGGDASLNAPIRDGRRIRRVAGLAGRRQRRARKRDLAEQRRARQPPPALIDALDVLNDRERRIFEARRLADDPITLEDLAAEFGVSRERVRQIEVRAFEKVQKAVKSSIAELEQPKPQAAVTAGATMH